MAQQTINVGAAANDGTGELGPRGWLQKVNANFNESYAVGTTLAPTPGFGFFNVKAYGAVGDGVTDDTAAIQATITAAGASTYMVGLTPVPAKNVVVIPFGKYKCTATLTVPRTISMWGTGLGSSTLDFTTLAASATAVQWGDQPVGNAIDVPVWQGISLYGPGIGTTSIGIQMGGASGGNQQEAQATFRDAVIDSFGTGVAFGLQAFNSLFEHVVIRNCGTGHSDTVANATLEVLSFVCCTFSRNTMHVNINPVNGAGVEYAYYGCSFDYAAAEPHLTIGSASNVKFDSCHFETDRVGSAGAAVFVRIVFPCDCLKFDNCDFVFKNAPTGIPVAWDTATTLNGTILFENCRGSSIGAAFYNETATGTGFSPVVVVINSPVLTSGNHLFMQLVRGRIIDATQAPAWGASVPVDCTKGQHILVNATSNIAATIANPTNPPINFHSQYLDVEITNTSGGALSTPVAWGTAYKNTGTVSPGNNLSIVIRFRYDGPLRGAWLETGRTSAAV